jgi:hypothetical protein
MKNGFVASPSDIGKLRHRVLSQLEGEQIVCSHTREVGRLEQADAVYFVISDISMSSTAYQELVLAAFLMTEQSHRWLLRLDDVEIPEGFFMLRSLPETDLGLSEDTLSK